MARGVGHGKRDDGVTVRPGRNVGGEICGALVACCVKLLCLSCTEHDFFVVCGAFGFDGVLEISLYFVSVSQGDGGGC